MNRFYTYRNNEAIQAAHRIIPNSILNRLHFDYFIGADPIYAGISDYEKTTDGRSYRDTACVMYPWHFRLTKEKTTIVIPKERTPRTIIHEIGHVIDEYLGFEHIAVPVTEYAKTDRYEAFAEAFTAWLLLGYANYPCKTVSGIDLKTESLFESLRL